MFWVVGSGALADDSDGNGRRKENETKKKLERKEDRTKIGQYFNFYSDIRPILGCLKLFVTLYIQYFNRKVTSIMLV